VHHPAHAHNNDPITGFKHHTSSISTPIAIPTANKQQQQQQQGHSTKRSWSKDGAVDSLIASFMKIRQEKETKEGSQPNLTASAAKEEMKIESAPSTSLNPNPSSPGKFRLGQTTKSQSFNDEMLIGNALADPLSGHNVTAMETSQPVQRERRHSVSEGVKQDASQFKSLFEQIKVVPPLAARDFAR
jgi:hypothetical protein